MKKTIFKSGITFACILLLAGCSMVRTSISTTADINPDVNGQPSPIVVKMYQLRDDDLFEQANFFSLFDAPESTLETQLISTREIVLAPADSKHVWISLDPNTQYIGVVAGFRLLDNTPWRQVIALDKTKSHYMGIGLNITLSNAGLVVTKDKV